jgi:hypothetical protein
MAGIVSLGGYRVVSEPQAVAEAKRPLTIPVAAARHRDGRRRSGDQTVESLWLSQ